MTDARDTHLTKGAPPAPDRRRAIARWERERARGRTTFVIKRGVLGWGLPAAALTVAYKLMQAKAFTWALIRSHELRFALAVATFGLLLCGYFFGHWLWRTGEENYGRMKREEEAER